MGSKRGGLENLSGSTKLGSTNPKPQQRCAKWKSQPRLMCLLPATWLHRGPVLDVHWVRQEGELSTSPKVHGPVAAALTHLFHKNSCDIMLFYSGPGSWLIFAFTSTAGSQTPSCGFALRETESEDARLFTVFLSLMAQMLYKCSQYFSDICPLGPGMYPEPCFVGNSAWEGALSKMRIQESTITNTEADSDHGASRHFPHHYKKQWW